MSVATALVCVNSSRAWPAAAGAHPGTLQLPLSTQPHFSGQFNGRCIHVKSVEIFK